MAEAIDIRALNEQIERQSAFVTNLMTGMDQVIVGQKHLVESLLIGLLSDGHILLEGVPGLAGTECFAGSHAGTSGHTEQRNISVARTIFSNGYPKSD